MPRLLYILSLERSGSTALSYNLSQRSGIVALGEVDRTLALVTRPDGFQGRSCSCGSSIQDCPVWGSVVSEADQLRHQSLDNLYRQFDMMLESALGPHAVVVDASKSLTTLKAIAPVFQDRLCVAHLVKDVRAYMDSTLNRMASLTDERLWSEAMQDNPLRTRLMRAMPASIVYLWRWSHQNVRMCNTLRTSDIDWLRVSYDAMCEDVDYWLDLMARMGGAGDVKGQHHILLGSFDYLDQASDKALRLDCRWRTSPRRPLLEIAHAFIAILNHRLTQSTEIYANCAHYKSFADSTTT